MYTTESKAVERAYTKVVANIAALSKPVAETHDELSCPNPCRSAKIC